MYKPINHHPQHLTNNHYFSNNPMNIVHAANTDNSVKTHSLNLLLHYLKQIEVLILFAAMCITIVKYTLQTATSDTNVDDYVVKLR